MKTFRFANLCLTCAMVGLSLLLLPGPPLYAQEDFTAEADKAARDKTKPGVIRFTDGEAAGKAGAAVEVKPESIAAVDAFLARRVQISISEMGLGEVVKRLSDLSDVQIELDRINLDAINVTDEVLVSLDVKGMSVATALRHLLRGIDPTLRCVVVDGTLTITTAEAAQEHMVRTIYDVRDLATPKPKESAIRHVGTGIRPPEDESLANLIDVIQHVVDPASWESEGGTGQIKSMGGELLIVTQSREAQQTTAALLETLRTIQKNQKDKGGGALRAYAIAPRVQQQFAEQVRKALQQPVGLDFENARFEDVLVFLSRLMNVPIHLDKVALEAINITGESTVTVHIKNVSARSALNLLLRRLDPTLTWSCQDEVLMVTTKEAACEHLCQVVYPMLDLIEPDPASGLPKIEVDALCELISASIEPSSWDSEGGPGACRYVSCCSALVVTQTEGVQEQVAALLDDVRKIRRLQGATKPDAKAAVKNDAVKNDALKNDAAPPLDTSAVFIYHLGRVGKSAWIGWSLTDADSISDRDLAELKKSIVELTGADKWPAGTTSIRCVGKQLIIRQTPAVHEQIFRLLNELGVLEQEGKTKPFGLGGSNVVGFLGR